VLLTKNTNTNSIYIQNTELSITYSPLTDLEQAEQFAFEIQDYSLCATVENQMIQPTEEKE